MNWKKYGINFDPSEFQERIFNFVLQEDGSAVIIATAGSGKTTTGVGCTFLLPSERKSAYVAFAKPIAMELQRRVPKYVQAKTVHSLSFLALRNYFGGAKVDLDENKIRNIIWDEDSPCYMNRETWKQYGTGVEELVAIAKAHGLLPRGASGVGLMMDTESHWADLIEKFGIEFEGANAKPEIGIDYARRTLLASIKIAEKHRYIDFDDQLYLPMIWQAKFEQFDNLLVDEAQDISPIQLANLKMSLKIGGRLFAFGDPCQAIFAWRGADTESIEKIKQEFNAIELPLSISYRCPKVVVAEAQKYVPYIQASPTAPEGILQSLPNIYPELFTPTDAIVCRTNAPLIDLAYKLLRNRIPCKVLGRKIGEGLVTVINKMKADTIEELEERLIKYRDREVQKLIAKGKEMQAANIDDKVDTVKIFIGMLPETDRTVNRLIREIEGLFEDKNVGRLTLCSVHRAKGLEWNRVFILNRHKMPSLWARQAWQKEEESHLIYVATTRAMKELYFIDQDKWTDKKPEGKEAA